MGEMISIARPDGSAFPAYLVSVSTHTPAVVVLHAYWGLTNHYLELSERFGREGFSVLAPSLYDGDSSDDPDVADKLMDALDEDRTEEDLGRSLDRLLEAIDPPEGGVAAVGFSMGGWAATRLAAARSEVAAVVPFYGYSQGADYGAMRAAAQAHFATVDEDDEVDPAQFERLLRGAGREVEVHLYAARHGFFNNDHPEDYDAEAASRSWERMLGFIRKHTAS
jgi:carboxymethylenebutenolidase